MYMWFVFTYILNNILTYDVNIGIGKSTFIANLPLSGAYKDYVSEFPPLAPTMVPPPTYAQDPVQPYAIVVPITLTRYA